MHLRGYRKTFVVTLTIALAFILALKKLLTGEFATIAAVCIGSFNWANSREPRPSPVKPANVSLEDPHVSDEVGAR